MPTGLNYLVALIKKKKNDRCREKQESIREFMREYLEYQKQQEYHRNCQCKKQEFVRRHMEFHKRHRESLRKHQEFSRYHRRLRYLRPVILIVNLVVWYIIFRYLGIKVISVIFAVILSLGGIFEIFFLRHLEKRVFDPIEKLKKGVEEITRGNYDIRVECDVLNDITLLVASFNEMAQRLQEGEKIKTDYEENRRTLVANISHDLKTPITTIQGYIEVIADREDLPREDLKRYLQIISRNTSYMNKLIDDLFLFSKLDLQKLDFNYEYIEARHFMADLMEELQVELEEKDIEFTYADKLEGECPVDIDRKRIYQAIRNIIGNAVKYGPEKDLSINVEMYRRDGYLCLAIKDNGPGISEDKLLYIFDRFYRIDTERTKDVMSTGLGLAIARELLEAHGGKISASSTEGRGSCFTIMLPVAENHRGALE